MIPRIRIFARTTLMFATFRRCSKHLSTNCRLPSPILTGFAFSRANIQFVFTVEVHRIICRMSIDHVDVKLESQLFLQPPPEDLDDLVFQMRDDLALELPLECITIGNEYESSEFGAIHNGKMVDDDEPNRSVMLKILRDGFCKEKSS